MPRWWLTLGSVAVALAASQADALTLRGALVQGGMVVGETEPGSRIELDGRALAVDRDGRFVFGFGHDAGASAVLDVTFANGGRESRRLSIRQRQYRIQRINGLPQRMVIPSAQHLARIRAEARTITSARATLSALPHFAGKFMWPVNGTVSSVYGSRRILNGKPRRPHLGVDIAVAAGTPVRAAAAGMVTLGERELYFTGGTVVIDHGLGISTVYSHLRELYVKAGDRVAQGDVVGTVGSTGRSTGAHLDWRINWFQERLDPVLVSGPMPQ